MKETGYVVKVGKEYVSHISLSEGLITSTRDKFVFDTEEEAKTWSDITSKLTFGYDTPKVLSVEEDTKERTFVGSTLRELLEKAMPQTLEKAKEMYTSNYLTNQTRTYTSNGQKKITSLVKSQTNYRCYYNVEILLDKDNKVVEYTCNCEATKHNPLCKHILVAVLGILDI